MQHHLLHRRSHSVAAPHCANMVVLKNSNAMMKYELYAVASVSLLDEHDLRQYGTFYGVLDEDTANTT